MYNILSSESGILIFLSGLPALIYTCYFKIIMTRGWLQTQNFALKKTVMDIHIYHLLVTSQSLTFTLMRLVNFQVNRVMTLTS